MIFEQSESQYKRITVTITRNFTELAITMQMHSTESPEISKNLP